MDSKFGNINKCKYRYNGFCMLEQDETYCSPLKNHSIPCKLEKYEEGDFDFSKTTNNTSSVMK